MRTLAERRRSGRDVAVVNAAPLLHVMQLPSQTKSADEVPWAEIPSFQVIDPELRRVRDLVRHTLVTPEAAEELAPLYDYLCIRSGKMIRPGLVLLAGKCFGPLADDHIRAAAMVEMIHNATLLHDDVIDDGQRRRGVPTVNHLCGNETAVLLGDFVLSRVFKMAADLDADVAKVIAQTAVRVCEGELRQVIQRRNWQLDEAEYIDIITEKSAAFFSGCCRIGAMLAHAPAEQIEALARYGLHVGIAFQITDDVLDITGDEQRMGKAAQNDFDKSKLTLAVIHLLAQTQEETREEILAMLESPADAKTDLARLLAQHGSLRYARQRAEAYAAEAVEPLADTPDGQARDALTQIAAFVVNRSV